MLLKATGPAGNCKNFTLKKTFLPSNSLCFTDRADSAVILLSLSKLQTPGTLEL